jgi:hypothetical protein
MSTPKDGETRRDLMIWVAAGAAAAATVSTQAKAQTPPRIIRAVAIGTGSDVTISADGEIPRGARPYIRGLVAWLALTAKTQPRVTDVGQYVLGTGGANSYTIEFRERPLTNLASAFDGVSGDSGHLLFCMSTSCGDAAIDFMEESGVTVPMVVISSHWDNFEQNHVCVVSAERPQLIRQCLSRFNRHVPRGTIIHALHRQDHVPSTDALRRLGNRVQIEPVKDTEDPGSVVDRIDVRAGTHGLLVLPADRFFAAAADIHRRATAKRMPTFWTTPDWPADANGAYGYKQEVCGRYMAERVGRIWDHNVPDKDKKNVTILPGEREEKSWTPLP